MESTDASKKNVITFNMSLSTNPSFTCSGRSRESNAFFLISFRIVAARSGVSFRRRSAVPQGAIPPFFPKADFSVRYGMIPLIGCSWNLSFHASRFSFFRQGGRRMTRRKKRARHKAAPETFSLRRSRKRPLRSVSPPSQNLTSSCSYTGNPVRPRSAR